QNMHALPCSLVFYQTFQFSKWPRIHLRSVIAPLSVSSPIELSYSTDILEDNSLSICSGFRNDSLCYTVENLLDSFLSSLPIFRGNLLPCSNVAPPEGTDDASCGLGYLYGLRDIEVNNLVVVSDGYVSQVPVDSYHSLDR